MVYPSAVYLDNLESSKNAETPVKVANRSEVVTDEENFEDDSEINMEQPLQNSSDNCEVDIDGSYVESSDDVVSANTENDNAEEEEIEVANECVNDMDVEY